MLKGIVIIATSHPYYGKMAHNLAVTIRATGTQIPICVLHSGRGLSHLSEKQKTVFDIVKEIPADGLIAKLHPEFSPFQKTLLLDADMAWLPYRKPEQLFEELAGNKFTAITEGFIDFDGVSDVNVKYPVWSDATATQKAYGLKGKMYQWRSEVVYFEKCKEVTAMYERANKIFKNPKVEVTKFAEGIPDEFALSVAACQTQTEPHAYKWKVSYWFPIAAGRSASASAIGRDYYLLSVGGKSVGTTTRRMYDGIVGAAHYKLRMQYVFLLQSKINVMPERRKN
jgi:hypothetical protein